MKKKALLAATAILCLTAGIAWATSNTVVTTNADGSTTTRTTTYYYQDYDLNNNGILDSTEFPKYVYHRWDVNGDGFVSSDEWNRGVARWYPAERSTEYKTYTFWDKDADGRLDPNEFDSVVTTTKLYNTWDMNADNIIQSDEYATSSFQLYDTDDDGIISLAEWQAAYK